MNEKAIPVQRFPDIGSDPLKNPDNAVTAVERMTADPTAGAMDRLAKAAAVQQPEVPDQTALVWRIDIERVRMELIWRRAAMKSHGEQIDILRHRLSDCERRVLILTDNNKEADV
jgi:hypothetical protein